MIFMPAPEIWDELTSEEISAKLSKSESDIAEGCVCTQDALDARMIGRFTNGQHTSERCKK